MRARVILVAPLLALRSLQPADCDGNGIDDARDTAPDRAALGTLVYSSFEPGRAKLAVGDLDADRDADVVLLRLDSLEIEVHENIGRGRLSRRTILPAPAEPRDLLIGDLDRDGDGDLVHLGADRATVLMNRGGAEFRSAESIPLGSNPVAIILGDLNGDGSLDFACGNSLGIPGADSISVGLNAGSGDFHAARNYVAGDEVSSLAAADLDADGDLDLAAAAMASNAVILLKNDGAGAFPSKSEVAIGAPILVAAGDLDGDRRPDLAVLSNFHEITLLFDDGTAGFPRRFVLNREMVAAPSLPFADIDGDLDVDIALLSGACPTLKLFVNDGRGTFTVLASETLSLPLSVREGDMDADGISDLCVLGSMPAGFPGMQVLRGTVAGHIPDWNRDGIPDECQRDCNRTRLPDDFDIDTGLSLDCDSNGVPDECDPDCDADGTPDRCEIARGDVADCNRNGVPDACEPADDNGNGIPDECDVSSGSSPDCNGNGRPDEADLRRRLAFTQTPGEQSDARAITSGDLDGDGDSDLVILALTELVLHWDDAGTFTRRTVLASWPSQGLIAGGFGVTALDVDGDGDIDLISFVPERGCPGNRLSGVITIWINEGRGSFGRHQTIIVPAIRFEAFCVADLDGDRDVDLVAVSGEGLWLIEGQGAAAFAPVRKILDYEFDPSRRVASRMKAFDIDGDRRLDLVTDGGLTFLGAGSSRFHAGPEFQDFSGGFDAADLDGDGDLDFITGGRPAWNAGDGTFAMGERLSLRTAVDGIARDFDGDGTPDLAILSLEGTFLVFLNRGARVFDLAVEYLTCDAPSSLATGDFDGDGNVDLATLGTSGFCIHERKSDVTFVSRETIVPGFATDLHAADLDRDGDTDLLYRGEQQEQGWGLFVLLNDGRGGLVPRLRADLRSFLPQGLEDMDQDGDPDLLLYGSEGVRILLNDGTGSFDRNVEAYAEGGVWRLSAADLDTDGDMDLAIAPSGFAQLSRIENRGGLSFGQATPVVDDGVLDWVVADVDGARGVDLVLLGNSNSVLLNDGAGGFSRGAAIPLGNLPHSGVAVDVDGDADLDLVFSLLLDPIAGQNGLAVALNEGNGVFSELVVQESTSSLFRLQAADLDLDGDADLLGSESFLDILLNDGSGRFRPWGSLSCGAPPSSVAAVDLDDDSLPELLVTSNGLLKLSNTTLSPRSADANRDGIPDECGGVQFRRGDWNQDGMFDLTDAVGLLEHLFRGADPGPCLEAGDADDSGLLDLTDPIRVLEHLFQGAPALPEPFAECGLDASPGALDCSAFAGCA